MPHKVWILGKQSKLIIKLKKLQEFYSDLVLWPLKAIRYRRAPSTGCEIRDTTRWS